MKYWLAKLPGVLSNVAALLLVFSLALGAFALWLLDPIPMQNLRLAQFDQFQRWSPRVYEPAPVRVVDIDEASLAAFGQWPWPRTQVAELVDQLHRAGAAAVVVDLLLAEPDRTSPATVATLWKNASATAALRRLPDHDQLMGTSLVDKGVVLAASLARTGAKAAPGASGPAKADLPYRIVATGAQDPVLLLNRFDTAIWPLPVLSAGASGVGAVNFSSDSDGVVRRVPLMLGLNEQILPSLAAEGLRVATGARNYLLRSTAAGMQDVRIGNITIPTNAQGDLWLHYTKPQPDRFVSAGDVLRGKVPAEKLQGNIVLVGTSAAGLMDLRFNPMGEIMPGVQAHALVLEQVLLGRYLQRPAWAGGAEALVLTLGALVVGLVALGAPALWASLFGGVVLAGVLGGGWYAFTEYQLLLDVANPAVFILLTFGLASGMHHLVSEREQRWVREAFSRYVSPNRVAHLVAHPEQLQLGGQRQMCSFVFTDLAGFTAMMEAGDPGEAVTLLNEYLDGMLGIVFKHDGTLDRIVGDAVAVLFSAPVPQADHRERALRCALDMHRFALDFAVEPQSRGIRWGHTRIGVHSGEVIVGNFGGKTLFDYRALGDPINTAARLESVNKHLGTQVCVSEAIMQACPDVKARSVGRLVLKGKTQPLHVFEPLDAQDAGACAPLAEYDAAMAVMMSPDPEVSSCALEEFERLTVAYPKDPLVKLHVLRLREGAQSDLIVMSEK